MILAFENLKGFDEMLVKALEPFIDFKYSRKDRSYYWQRHHFIVEGKDIYKLRLHSASNLKQGLICNNFEDAIDLTMLIEGTNPDSRLNKEYPWLEGYLEDKKDSPFIKSIAIPVSEYIKYYAADFKMLQLLDFEDIFNFKNK